MCYRESARFAFVLTGSVLIGAVAAYGQECKPSPDGFGCVPLVCSDIPEDQCLATVLHLDLTTGAIITVACECMNFSYCHIEFGDASPLAVGYCPDGHACEVFAWDADGDGIEDHLAAQCVPGEIGACCHDGPGHPIPSPPYPQCAETPADVCEFDGGLFLGPGTVCEPMEACCVSFGGSSYCIDASPNCCEAYMGMAAQGPGTTCSDIECVRYCGGWAGDTCLDGEFCKYYVGDCNDWADASGVCTPIQTDPCPPVWDPVCGCDGITYGSECEADAAGRSIAHYGPCGDPCATNADCDDGNMCTDDYCHWITRTCVYRNNTAPCDDGDPCTADDVCMAGVCVGTPIPGCGECLSNADCPDPDQFCLLPPGTCGEGRIPGVCTPRPTGCPDVWDPVCGCDGQTYSNECDAHAAGVSIRYYGECEPLPCMADADCLSTNEFCKFPVGTCGDANVPGVCTPIPEICITLWDPVCGCDDVTYGNECEAAAAAMSIAYRGECKQFFCMADADCRSANEFCKFPEGTCGAGPGIPGVCTPIPEVCITLWDPVCGCDGVTYGNECVADVARMSIAHRGECEGAIGPDLIVHDIQNVMSYGAEGDISAFSIGTEPCNVGSERVSWIAHTNEHPVIAQNMYRLKEGRFEQIGMSWLVHGFYAVSQSACGPCEDYTDGTELGVGCSSPHSAYLNGVQGNMSLRADVNAHTGYFPYPWTATAPQTLIDKRLQVHNIDLDPALNPGALYFVEGHYVAADEAAAGNGNDNVSHRQVTITGPHDSGALYQATVISAAHPRQPAARAWQDHDPTVLITEVHVPGEGLLILAAKAVELGDGAWRYEYALQNVNSHRSCGSFNVPLPAQGVIGAVGFHDVDYHSGEPFDGTDWETTIGGGGIMWATAGYEVNPNANALRWGTLYNFGFNAITPPQPVEATIGLFRPGSPDSVQALTLGPSVGGCVPTDDGTGCVPYPCSPIPEDQCLPTLVRVDPTGVPPIVVACECMDFNFCHIELKHGVPVAIGHCPDGGTCQVVELDLDGDGIYDHLTAECVPGEIGACCFDVSGGPLPHPQCVELTRDACKESGGFFAGIGTWCEPLEACCLPSGSVDLCVDVSPICCKAFGGIPQGPGTTCEDVVCGEPCGGPNGILCDDNSEFCKYPEGTCGAGGVIGTCTPVPGACPFLWDPVCGCDGLTYTNECVAGNARVSVAHRGECAWACCDPNAPPDCPGAYYCCADGHWECADETGHDPCDAPGIVCQPVCGGPYGIPCDDSDSFCKFRVGTCGEHDVFGMCTQRPDACPEYFDPVCGCDGMTYGNKCEADAAGVSIAHWGECEPQYCWSNDMCRPHQYCFFHVCAAETGVCVRRPEACPDVWEPVCGCDGVTYYNACEAARAGRSVDYPGMCEDTRCFSNDMCEPDQYCFFHCCLAETGACVARPETCPDIWDPVCGCDNVTYPNACEAARAGMSVDYHAECGDYCSPFDPDLLRCPPDEFCKFPPGRCDDTTALGVCTSIPEDCAAVWAPVCGCDGVTYDNECFADMAQVWIDYYGECEACSAWRVLSPPTYCPGMPKWVQIHLSPATAVALEDAPPAGWEVIYISHDGVYDEVNGKVKWGPFFEETIPRSVGYEVIPPENQDGVACFEGTISLDGLNEPICGDDCIERHCSPAMAADTPQPPCPACPVGDCTACPEPGCHDWRISLCEVVSYACAWLRGCNDDLAGVTRAAYVWRNGECYCWDEDQQNWFPTACPPPASGLCGGGPNRGANVSDGNDSGIAASGSAVAHIRFARGSRHGKDREMKLSIAIDAPKHTFAMALDFQMPEGWQVTFISDGGKWDELNRKAKWGPFYQDLSRTVTLKARRTAHSVITPTRRPTHELPVDGSGMVSFDGINRPIAVE